MHQSRKVFSNLQLNSDNITSCNEELKKTASEQASNKTTKKTIKRKQS